VPKSSAYQYFPDKNAILWQLLLGYQHKLQSRLAKILDRVESADQLPDAVDRMVDATVRIYRTEKELVTIAASVHANTALREMDADSTARIAAYLAERFEQLLPGADPEAVRDAFTFASQMAGPTIYIALFWKSRDSRRLIREFKTLLRLRLETLIG
jgi:AcrR family transcriptional regulator